MAIITPRKFKISFIIMLLVLSLLFSGIACSQSKCKDIKGDSDNDAWTYLLNIEGQTLTVEDSKMNSTYTIGICTNVRPRGPDHIEDFAAVIEHTQDNETVVVGRYNDTDLMSGSHWILLEYMSGDSYPRNVCSSSDRHAVIMFVCNHKVTELDKARIIDENLGRQRDCYHLFEVEHCLACISDGCDAFLHRYSPGSIILIGFFSLVGAYLLFGWIYTRFVAGKRGWSQIPNAAFWQEIGHLQADGCSMVCKCGNRIEDNYLAVAGDSHNFPSQSNSLLSDDDEHLLPP